MAVFYCSTRTLLPAGRNLDLQSGSFSAVFHSTRIIIAISALVGATACRQPLPCDDCDAHEDEQDAAEDPIPDLPCGGADLMTDNDNCGVCGNECDVWYEGTEWEGGGCEAGKCGPRWHNCWNSTGNASTCDEICTAMDLSLIHI